MALPFDGLAKEVLDLMLRAYGRLETESDAHGALHTLRGRFAAVPHGRELFVAVVQMVLAARRGGARLTEAVMLDVTEAEEFLRKERLEGRLEGRLALLGGYVRQCERKLGRSLAAAERAGLERRIDADGAERAGDAILDLDAQALAAWLAGA